MTLSYTMTTAPLGPRLAAAIAYRGAVTDTNLASNHYRIVGNDRLLWSGHTTTWEADPRRFVRRLKADVAAVYPQLADVEVEHAWSGVLGNALHRMPQIGELSGGLWLASGFGGHGINTTAMAGNILAQAVVEGDDAWRLFAPFELVWAGGRLGRAAMQVFYWWFNGLERFEARAARQREAEDQRVAGRAVRRDGDDEMDVEARLGAVVPRADLPEEPALAELPADPLAPSEIVSPPIKRESVDAPLEAPAQENFLRGDLPDVSVVEDDAARSRPVPDARPKRPV